MPRNLYEFSRKCAQLVMLCIAAEILVVVFFLQGFYVDFGRGTPTGPGNDVGVRDDRLHDGGMGIEPGLNIYSPPKLPNKQKFVVPRVTKTPPQRKPPPKYQPPTPKNRRSSDRSGHSLLSSRSRSRQGIMPDSTGTQMMVSIGLGLAITSRNAGRLTSDVLLRQKFPFFSMLLPSFCRTASKNWVYHFYVAYDYNDTFFNHMDTQVLFQAVFDEVVREKCPQPSNVFLHFVQCDHTRHPAWAQNDAMIEAYIDHVDYLYRINDDTVMESPQWTEKFVYTLQAYDPPNIGVVGPNHKGGNFLILTYDFVHRSHVDVFGYYYPRVFTDWYADGWITNVYLPGRTTKVKDVLLTHFTNMGQRYREDRAKKPLKAIMIEHGKRILERYLDAVHASNLTQKFPGKRVISTYLVGHNFTLNFGAMRNFNLIQVHLPGWKFRVYLEKGNAEGDTVHEKVPSRIIRKLYQMGAEIVHVSPETAEKIPPQMWRYLVVDDVSVDYFLVRDCSGRLGRREATAVKDWIKSSKAFHCMRDHPKHILSPIVDGLWGGRTPKIRSVLETTMHDSIVNFIDRFSSHYILPFNSSFNSSAGWRPRIANLFLRDSLWPKVTEHALCHDSVSCDKWPKSRRFPVARANGEWIGQAYDAYSTGRFLEKFPVNDTLKCVVTKPKS